MNRFFTGLLMRLLEKRLKLEIDYKQIDEKALGEWARKSFSDQGWRSYFGYEDLKILKQMSFGKGPWEYAVLVGRRLQLLYIFDEMKRAIENKKSEEEKRLSAAKQTE